jgi:Protein of unknown function (DUF1566)
MRNKRSHIFFTLHKYILLSFLFFAGITGIGCDELNEVDVPWPDQDPIAARFTDMGDGTVQDLDTGLIWLKDANAFGTLSWDDAMDEVANLSDGDLDGLTDGSEDGDWRLPSRGEWEEFVDRSYYRPPLSNAARNGQWSEGNPFTGVQTEASPGSPSAGAYYWSSTEGNTGFFWACYTGGYGSLMANDDIMSTPQYVWPVRDGEE